MKEGLVGFRPHRALFLFGETRTYFLNAQKHNQNVSSCVIMCNMSAQAVVSLYFFLPLLLLLVFLDILLTIFFFWPRRGKCGADFVNFWIEFLGSFWLLMFLFNIPILGYIAYTSLLTWLILIISYQKFPILFKYWTGFIISGWLSIVIALPILIFLCLIGIISINLYLFLLALLPGGFISYWLFKRTIKTTPYMAYKNIFEKE